LPSKCGLDYSPALDWGESEGISVGMKIVFVDDDPMVLHVLGGVFRRRGHAVLTYDTPLSCPIYTARHGACFPESTCPDIIISDYDMPEVDGAQFIETIMKKGCKCKRLALLSGKGIPDSVMMRLAKYGTRFFTKPLDFVELEVWLMLAERNG